MVIKFENIALWEMRKQLDLTMCEEANIIEGLIEYIPTNWQESNCTLCLDIKTKEYILNENKYNGKEAFKN